MDPEGSTFSSPFDNFLHYVPKEHGVAARQALYNVVGIAAFLALGVGAYYVSVILEPFLMPLFWAILTGFVLHPYKASLSDWLRQTIAVMRGSDSPCALVGLQIVGRSLGKVSDTVGDFIFSRLRLLALLIATVIVSCLLVQSKYVSVQWIQQSISYLWNLNVLSFLDSMTLFQICSLAVILFISLIFVPVNNEQVSFLKIGFVLLWLVLLAYLLNYLWSPVTTVVLILLAYVTGAKADATEQTDSSNIKVIFRRLVSIFASEDIKEEKDVVVAAATDDVFQEGSVITDLDGKSRSETVAPVTSTPAVPNPKGLDVTASAEVMQYPGVSALRKQKILRPDSSISSTPNRSNIHALGMSRRIRLQQFRSAVRQNPADSIPNVRSAKYIRGVVISCVLIQFYVRPWMLNLLPIPILCYIIKQGLSYFNIMLPLRNRINFFTSAISGWFEAHRHIMFPMPVRQLWQIYSKIEKDILGQLPAYTDSLVTALLIIFMIVTTVLMGIFISLELYSESMHMVQMSGKIVSSLANTTALHDVNESFWDPAYQSNIEELFETAYQGGRHVISTSVRQLLGKAEGGQAVDEIESKILELWDRIYQYWVIRKKGNIGPDVSEEAISSSFDDILTSVMQEQIFNWSSIVQFCKDNMGTFVSIVDHTWIILKGNFGLVVTLLLEVLKLLFLSSTSVVNFALSIVVYFTALFYLLTNSGRTYKPVEIMSKYGHVFASGFGEALDRAVTSIFWLTFKMVSFYSCWTYLTHTVFNASIVMVPVLAAAFLAAVPVAGQYFVPVPAALELWLSKGRPVAAIMLVFCHFAPTWVVDGAIYAEVKGGIHPWLTGLSIVGGIYCFGIPGTIYGPLILCAVFVVLSMYPNALHDFKLEKSGWITPTLQRAESVC